MGWLKRFSLVLLALPLVGAGSCDSDSPTAPDAPGPGAGASVALPTTVTLAIGESVLVDSVDVEVTFSSVAEDSRCPVDVTCVWAGRAVVALAISGSAGGASTIELEVGQWREVEGLRLTATALDPRPREGEEIRPEDYRLELSLARAGG